jgi:hypothetical protein
MKSSLTEKLEISGNFASCQEQFYKSKTNPVIDGLPTMNL